MVTESGISANSVGRPFSRSHSVPSEPVDERKTAKHRRRLHSDTAWHADEENVARQLKKGHSFPDEADEHPRERRRSRRKLVRKIKNLVYSLVISKRTSTKFSLKITYKVVPRNFIHNIYKQRRIV